MEITVEFLESALQSLKEEIFASLHVAMPGILQEYDAEKQTATVQPALVRRNCNGEDITAPLLRDVPVFRCHSGAEPGAGSVCLLIFADFYIDGWAETGEAAVPDSPRSHDLSDAFVLIR